MKLTHITLLSAGALLLLTGCYERGEVVPPSAKKIHKKKKAKMIYDFPILKLSAKTNSTLESENTEAASKSSSLRFPKMIDKPIENIETSQNLNETKVSTAIKKTKEKITNRKNTQIKKIDTTQGTNKVKKDALKLVIAQTKTLQEKDKPKIKKKSIHKRKSSKSSKSSQIPIISSITKADITLQDIPILNKIIPKPSTTSKGRIRKNTNSQRKISNNDIPTLDNSPIHAMSNNNNETTSFSGGTSRSSLDMAKIRIETDNFQTNIVLDSYKWVKYNDIPTEESPTSGIYFFKYESYKNRIVGHIKGYNSFSALVTKKDELLKNNAIIKDIYIDRYVGNDGIKFIIELREKVKVNIIDVEDPGSIIIELYPLKSK